MPARRSNRPPEPESLGGPPAKAPALLEAKAWSTIDGVWKPLFGSFFEQGISVEWHDFTTERDIDWARSFHPSCLELCLNFSGHARLQIEAESQALPPEHFALYTTHAHEPRAVRLSGSVHRFLTLEMSQEYLSHQCADDLTLLKPPLQGFVLEGDKAPPFLEIKPMPTGLLSLRGDFVEPRVAATATAAWYGAKILEVLAQTVFREDEPNAPLPRHVRVNRERVERARYLLERDLENPPSLEMLAADLQVSPFHLSRLFTDETGMSIPKFLRLRRMEIAAELLREGKKSVTEIAMMVGYSSLSSFNRAFVEFAGCCPGLYPKVQIVGRTPKR